MVVLEISQTIFFNKYYFKTYWNSILVIKKVGLYSLGCVLKSRLKTKCQIFNDSQQNFFIAKMKKGSFVLIPKCSGMTQRHWISSTLWQLLTLILLAYNSSTLGMKGDRHTFGSTERSSFPPPTWLDLTLLWNEKCKHSEISPIIAVGGACVWWWRGI